MKVPGLYEVHSFEKPWFTTWESAAALWLSLLGHWLLRLWQSRGKRRGEDASGPEEEQPLLAREADGETHSQVLQDQPLTALGRLRLAMVLN